MIGWFHKWPAASKNRIVEVTVMMPFRERESVTMLPIVPNWEFPVSKANDKIEMAKELHNMSNNKYRARVVEGKAERLPNTKAACRCTNVSAVSLCLRNWECNASIDTQVSSPFKYINIKKVIQASTRLEIETSREKMTADTLAHFLECAESWRFVHRETQRCQEAERHLITRSDGLRKYTWFQDLVEEILYLH